MAGKIPAAPGVRDDAGMRIPKAVRWGLWTLWWGSLAFSLWFLWALYVVLTTDI